VTGHVPAKGLQIESITCNPLYFIGAAMAYRSNPYDFPKKGKYFFKKSKKFLFFREARFRKVFLQLSNSSKSRVIL